MPFFTTGGLSSELNNYLLEKIPSGKARYRRSHTDAVFDREQQDLEVHLTNVCPSCFQDPGLQKRITDIRPDYPDAKCDFHPRRKGIPAGAVAKIVDPVFRSQFGWAEYNSMVGSQDGDELEYLIGDLTRAEEEGASRAVTDALMEGETYWPQDGEYGFYADDQYYVLHDAHYDHHSELWEAFVQSILHEQRFFNSRAKDLLAEIFDGLQFQRDISKRSPIYRIDPGTPQATFFRARQSGGDSETDKICGSPHSELGPPPEPKRRAGRMNPAGIGCFYGAYELSTCMAELRPTVGSTVVGARFELTRPIHVLDTTRFEVPMKPLSVFSQDYLNRVAQWSFMNAFSQEIAKPISPSDEHLAYIPTQAVAEYFLHHHNFKRDGVPARIEAIIFQSAQLAPGKNIVLLGDAAQVAGPPPGGKRTPSTSPFSETYLDVVGQINSFNPAIRLAAEPIQVRRVASASFTSDEIYWSSTKRLTEF